MHKLRLGKEVIDLSLSERAVQNDEYGEYTVVVRFVSGEMFTYRGDEAHLVWEANVEACHDTAN